MRILIRVDTSDGVGTGHLVRCLALAGKLHEHGARVTLACAPAPPQGSRMISEAGGELVDVSAGSAPARRHATEEVLPTPDQHSDAAATCKAVSDGPFDWVVVDHYGLDARWEEAMRHRARRILVIDDLASRPHDCDVLLDQNLRQDHGAPYDKCLPRDCERLLGPRYALIDDAFAEARQSLRAQRRDGVLISFGGSDPASLTLPVLRALLELRRDDLRMDVVVGALNHDAKAIRDFTSRTPNVQIHHATRDMAGLMARAQLYVGAGGTTSWERCCLALPGVVVSAAPNQVPACRALDEAGSHVYLGDAKSVAPETVAAAAISLLASPAWWSRLAERSSGLVDGLGAKRVAARLAIGEIRLREASAQDEEKILIWRNHPAVRRHSGDGKEIDRAAHARWFARVLADPSCHLLVGADARGESGVLRYDVQLDTARVSIYLAPERLGSGAGPTLLAAGERWLTARRPEVTAISADVQTGNEASARLFTGAGYRASRTTYLKNLTGRAQQ